MGPVSAGVWPAARRMVLSREHLFDSWGSWRPNRILCDNIFFTADHRSLFLAPLPRFYDCFTGRDGCRICSSFYHLLNCCVLVGQFCDDEGNRLCRVLPQRTKLARCSRARLCRRGVLEEPSCST